MTVFQIHRLTCNFPEADATHVARILSLSNIVFSTDPNSKYASLSEWQARLTKPSSLIVYLTAEAEGTEADTPIAFVFAHLRTHSPPLRDGTSETLHIWLAGVLPEWRRAGCLGRLVDEVMLEPHGYLTVSTIPATYPDMWNWLRRRGWTVDRELSEGKFLLSRVRPSPGECAASYSVGIQGLSCPPVQTHEL